MTSLAQVHPIRSQAAPSTPASTPKGRTAGEVEHTERLNLPIATFLLVSPILATALAWFYVRAVGFAGSDVAIFLFMYLAAGLSISAGYHRYYSHRTFECNRLVQFLFLVFGAASMENSVLNWASDHRYHHVYADRDGDPYNIKRGFWWAHIGWMFYFYPSGRPYKNSPDLKADRLVQWQDRYYLPISLIVGFGLPTLIGAFFGRPWGGFIWGGAVRMVVLQHVTFLINSAAHTFGRRTYAPESTATNNPLLGAVSFGEGYHSFHHAYAGDYRIGHKWYDIDMGKWLILTLRRLGLASKLRTTYRKAG